MLSWRSLLENFWWWWPIRTPHFWNIKNLQECFRKNVLLILDHMSFTWIWLLSRLLVFLEQKRSVQFSVLLWNLHTQTLSECAVIEDKKKRAFFGKRGKLSTQRIPDSDQQNYALSLCQILTLLSCLTRTRDKLVQLIVWLNNCVLFLSLVITLWRGPSQICFRWDQFEFLSNPWAELLYCCCVWNCHTNRFWSLGNQWWTVNYESQIYLNDKYDLGCARLEKQILLQYIGPRPKRIRSYISFRNNNAIVG